MIESVLFFAAGFLCALLAALILAPMLWRRAAHSTRKRIERSMPISYNELQAQKDHLRAEHALEQRKTEVALRKQRELTAEQAAELEEQGKRIEEMLAKADERDAEIADLSYELKDVRGKLEKAETELSAAALELGTTKATLAAHNAEIESVSRIRSEIEGQLARAREDADRYAATMTHMEAQIGAARDKGRQHKQDARDRASELRETVELLKTERKRATRLEDELKAAQVQMEELKDKEKRRKQQVDALRRDRVGSEADFLELEQRAHDAEDERAAMERELGEMTVRVNRIAKVLDGKKPEAVVEEFNARIAELMVELKAERARADDLQEQLQQADAPGQDDAALRAEIGELTAQIVHMASMLEGEDSPIPDIINGEDADERPNGHPSLAARVRALRERAEHEAAKDN